MTNLYDVPNEEAMCCCKLMLDNVYYKLNELRVNNSLVLIMTCGQYLYGYYKQYAIAGEDGTLKISGAVIREHVEDEEIGAFIENICNTREMIISDDFRSFSDASELCSNKGLLAKLFESIGIEKVYHLNVLTCK